MRKLKESETQKARLQQEVQVLIRDLEISQSSVKEVGLWLEQTKSPKETSRDLLTFQVTNKLTISERRCDDLAAKLREMTNLYEKTDHESKQRAQEIVRLANDLDRAKIDNENLRASNGKLSDEVRMLKQELDALKKRFHELDMENRKLAHDREELARAYKVN